MSSDDGYESGKQTLGCEKIRASIHFFSLLPLPPGFRSKQKRTATSRRIMCWSIRPQRWRCTSQDDELFCRTHRRTNVDTDGGTWRLFLFSALRCHVTVFVFRFLRVASLFTSQQESVWTEETTQKCPMCLPENVTMAPLKFGSSITTAIEQQTRCRSYPIITFGSALTVGHRNHLSHATA